MNIDEDNSPAPVEQSVEKQSQLLNNPVRVELSIQTVHESNSQACDNNSQSALVKSEECQEASNQLAGSTQKSVAYIN